MSKKDIVQSEKDKFNQSTFEHLETWEDSQKGNPMEKFKELMKKKPTNVNFSKEVKKSNEPIKEEELAKTFFKGAEEDGEEDFNEDIAKGGLMLESNFEDENDGTEENDDESEEIQKSPPKKIKASPGEKSEKRKLEITPQVFAKKKSVLYNTLMPNMKQEFCYSSIRTENFKDHTFMTAYSQAFVSRGNMKELVVDNPLVSDYYFTKLMEKKNKRFPHKYKERCFEFVTKNKHSDDSRKKHANTIINDLIKKEKEIFKGNKDTLEYQKTFGRVPSLSMFKPRKILGENFPPKFINKENLEKNVPLMIENGLTLLLLVDDFQNAFAYKKEIEDKKNRNKREDIVVEESIANTNEEKIDEEQYKRILSTLKDFLGTKDLLKEVLSDSKGCYFVEKALKLLPKNILVGEKETQSTAIMTLLGEIFKENSVPTITKSLFQLYNYKISSDNY